MQVLDYDTPRPSAFSAPSALVEVPIVSGVATLVAAGHSAFEEPFGIFTPGDALIQVGSPLLAVGLWIYWCVLARRHRLGIGALLFWLIWASLQLWFALSLGIGYFREPWNY